MKVATEQQLRDSSFGLMHHVLGLDPLAENSDK